MYSTQDVAEQKATELTDHLTDHTGVPWESVIHPVHFMGRKRGWLPVSYFYLDRTYATIVVIEGTDKYNAEIRMRHGIHTYTDDFEDAVECALKALSSVQDELKELRKNATVDIEYLERILEE